MKTPAHLYFRNLDIIRFIAAAMVLSTHVHGYVFDVYGTPGIFKTADSSGLTLIGQCVKTFFANLSIGVDVFFVISGFLITSLLLQERENNGRIDLRKFYMRRILRIWPLYYLILIVSYFFTKYYTYEPLPDYLPHLFFVGNFDMIRQNSFCTGKIFILWSICIEEHFYLFIPLVLAYMPIRRIPMILAGVIVASISYRFYCSVHYPEYWYRIYLHTLCRIDVIAIGCLLAYTYKYWLTDFALPGWARVTLILWLIVLLSTTEALNYDGWARACFFRYLYILPIAALFLDFVSSLSLQLDTSKWNLVNYLGKSSYSIYMWHAFTIVLVCNSLDKLVFLHHNKAIYIFSILIFTFILSTISYRFFELPILQLKKRFEV